MSTSNHPVLNDDPPPAYHDGRPIERLPAYRPGHLARHHPYGRHTPSLFQRLQLSPSAHTANYLFDPRIDAVVSSEPRSYESAETLIVLERLGYRLDWRTVPRQVPPSLLATIRTRLSPLRLLAL
ncbi:hypothetical protein PENSPDRAFT_285516 [Peniophora sp. CONT]|nr:hypothetical protein PENSPDRAFT_285516 [Peniophora sp. CONT]